MDGIPCTCPFILSPWFIKKSSVPYMVQIELTYISIMRNLDNILSDKYEIEALHLLREWERLQVKNSDYRNHCRFTHRCINQGIIPS